MSRAIEKSSISGIKLSPKALEKLRRKGFKYVQVKGLGVDRRYDYIEPSVLVLIPMKELPSDQVHKDIYAPIGSEILSRWANENNDDPEVVIAIDPLS